MTTKQNKAYFIVITICIVWIIGLIGYCFGKNKGRKETIEVINETVKDYDFYIYDKDNYGIDYGKGMVLYSDLDYALGYEYSRDDRKIHLNYVVNR